MSWRRFRVRRTALIALVGLWGCGGDDPAAVGGTLSVSPTSLTVTLEEGGEFTLSSAPAGSRLEWEVTSHPAWAVVQPMSGVINGEIVDVRVTVDALADAEPGEYRGDIGIISTGGAGSVSLVTSVASAPEATVTPSTLTYAGDDAVHTLTIENTGRGVLEWSLASTQGRLHFTPQWGQLGTGEVIQASATVDRTGLASGTWSDTVVVTTNAGGPARIPATFEIVPQPAASVEPGEATIFPDGDTATIHLSNPGTGPLTWSAAGSVAAIAVEPASGVLPVSETVGLLVTVDRTGLAGYGGVCEVRITSDAPEDPVVRVSLSPWSRPWSLDHRVVDADHSQPAGRIVTVSANPARLNVIDPVARTVQHVTLSLTPSAVSVRPDGLFAAVGHDGYVSYVDLTALEVQEVYAVTTDALDVVLASNGWVYVFPRSDQWESIRCIDLATGVETISGGGSIYAGTVARLHPSGDYMYGANRGLSPSDFEKYDIRGGTAQMMYDSPYHGDYDFSGDVWIAEDGTRLFARSGNSFRSSTVQEEDMTYAGSLGGVSWARWVEHSAAMERVLAFDASIWGDEIADRLRVYDDQYLALQGTVALPPVLVLGTDYALDGRFAFAAGDGSQVHVLATVDPASGALMDWTLLSAPADALP